MSLINIITKKPLNWIKCMDLFNFLFNQSNVFEILLNKNKKKHLYKNHYYIHNVKAVNIRINVTCIKNL